MEGEGGRRRGGGSASVIGPDAVVGTGGESTAVRIYGEARMDPKEDACSFPIDVFLVALRDASKFFRA